MCATRSWHSVVQHEGALCRPVTEKRILWHDQSPQCLSLLVPVWRRICGTEGFSSVSGLTWHLWHPSEFEVTHIGTQGEAIGPCEDGHPRTKLSVKDPGVQDSVLKHLLAKGTMGEEIYR